MKKNVDYGANPPVKKVLVFRTDTYPYPYLFIYLIFDLSHAPVTSHISPFHGPSYSFCVIQCSNFAPAPPFAHASRAAW